MFEGFDKPDDQWSSKRSPEYILKYFPMIHILVYSLGPATDSPVGTKLFHKHKFVHLPIPSMFDLINEIIQIFTIPMHGQPQLNLL